MPISEARKRANQKWNDANLKSRYDHIHLTVPAGFQNDIRSAASAAGESVNGYIKRAIEMRMDAEKEGRP